MFVVSFRGRSWAFSLKELRPPLRAVRRPRRDGSQGGWAQEVASLPRNTLRSSALSSQTDRSQKAAKAAPELKIQSTMNDSRSRFAKMPAAPPSPPALPRKTWASLGSPTEETGEAWSRPAWTRGASAEERAWARYGRETALPASPAPESPASAAESWNRPTWARGASAEANAWEAAMAQRRPQ